MAEHTPTPDCRSPGSPLELLIVEDEILVAWSMVEMLHRLGHKVCATVSTQGAALEAMVRYKPDVILMDYKLSGGGDGLAIARRIREIQDTPIIFCTAYVSGVIGEVHSLPGTQLISKPVSQISLREALGKVGTWAQR